MSADWPLAVQLGATYVRVGSGDFRGAGFTSMKRESAMGSFQHLFRGQCDSIKCGL